MAFRASRATGSRNTRRRSAGQQCQAVRPGPGGVDQDRRREHAGAGGANAAINVQGEAQKKLDAPINDCVDQARWPLSPMSHHIGNQMDNAKRRKRVFDYVRDYYAKHSRFPAGSHTLHQDFRVQFPED